MVILFLFQEIGNCKTDVTYRLQWTLEMWTEIDGDHKPYYEPYGRFIVDIGHRLSNQNIKLWNVTKANYMEVPANKSRILEGECIFRESDEFKRNGIITFHGEVMEYDDSNDNIIGNYEGKVYTMVELNTNLHFPGDGAYVNINIEITVN